MKFKKILILGTAIITAVVTGLTAFADAKSVDEDDPCRLGCIPETQEEIEEFFGEPQTFPAARSALPSSVDLSTDPCFPPIGNQGKLGSCASFATTYYQFTYEVNKLNGVTNKDDIVIYSPKWTYNLSNYGIDAGSEITDNYNVLMDLGCLQNSDFAYTGLPNDYVEIPQNMQQEKLEALSTKVVDMSLYEIPNTASIASPDSQALYNIKSALHQGKVLITATMCNFNSYYAEGNCIVYRCTDLDNDSHAVTIVGYDDNISYDVNGNGTIETCEKGAFKVANSWGKSYNSYGIISNETDENAGYFWVLYDAMNLVSTNTVNNWESGFNNTRYPAFSHYYTSNGSSNFYSIDVAHKNVNIVGELDINTTDRSGITMKINRTGSNVTSWQSSNAKTIANFKQKYINQDGKTNQNISYDGYLLFDFSSYDEPISQYISGFNWHIRLDNIQSSATSASLRLIDNKGNALTGYKHLIMGNVMTIYHNLSLQKGDVNYDGSVTVVDSSIIMNYVSMITQLSDLQHELADYNNDGVVNVSDVITINMNLSSNASASEMQQINALNARAYNFMSLYGTGGDLNEID